MKSCHEISTHGYINMKHQAKEHNYISILLNMRGHKFQQSNLIHISKLYNKYWYKDFFLVTEAVIIISIEQAVL